MDYFAYGEGIFVALALLVGLVAVLALFSGPRLSDADARCRGGPTSLHLHRECPDLGGLEFLPSKLPLGRRR